MPADRPQFRLAPDASRDSWRISVGHLDRYEGPFLLCPGVSDSLKATVEVFSRAYEEAAPDEQAALRAWMRGIILPGKARRQDLEKCKSNEKESVVARDRRILEFPLSISPNEVAKALKTEGWYGKGTTIYYIGFRVRRLREKAEGVSGRTLFVSDCHP